MRFQLFIQNRSFGAMELLPDLIAGRVLEPSGRAWTCPMCAEVWAVATAPGRRHFVLTSTCPNCPASHDLDIPGSIWDGGFRDSKAFNDSLPPDALSREFELHLKWYEKEHQNGLES